MHKILTYSENHWKFITFSNVTSLSFIYYDNGFKLWLNFSYGFYYKLQKNPTWEEIGSEDMHRWEMDASPQEFWTNPLVSIYVHSLYSNTKEPEPTNDCREPGPKATLKRQQVARPGREEWCSSKKQEALIQTFPNTSELKWGFVISSGQNNPSQVTSKSLKIIDENFQKKTRWDLFSSFCSRWQRTRDSWGQGWSHFRSLPLSLASDLSYPITHGFKSPWSHVTSCTPHPEWISR